jgi:hypothetical protein
VRWTIRER